MKASTTAPIPIAVSVDPVGASVGAGVLATGAVVALAVAVTVTSCLQLVESLTPLLLSVRIAWAVKVPGFS